MWLQNPTLQAVFAGTTSLTVQKTPLPSFSLSSPFGSNGTSSVQLYYSPNATAPVVEQFYCGADSCVQANRTATIDWVCQNLQCVLIFISRAERARIHRNYKQVRLSTGNDVLRRRSARSHRNDQ